MFELKKNMFLENNTCNYVDEYNNTVFMKRTEKGFVAKIRFANKSVTAEPLVVEAYAGDKKEGDYLDLHFSDQSVLSQEDVMQGLKSFTVLVEYWVNMIRDIKLLDLNNSLFLKANPGMTDEDVARHKFSIISQYKELEAVKQLVGL